MKKYRVARTIYYEVVVEAMSEFDASLMADKVPNRFVGINTRTEEIKEDDECGATSAMER